ncbi:MAG: hypothetical protein AAFV88_16110 [Planctomycetota bacterium]
MIRWNLLITRRQGRNSLEQRGDIAFGGNATEVQETGDSFMMFSRFGTSPSRWIMGDSKN